MVFDGSNDNVEIPNVAGNSVIDAYFVNRHDNTSITSADTNRYLYLSDNVTAKYGFVGEVNALTASIYHQYGTPNLYKNNTLLSPTNRGDVYSLIGQTQNIINHQGVNLSTWNGCNFGRYPANNRSWDFEGTLQEIIIFRRVLSNDERNRLHDDIMDFYKISN